MPRLYKARLPKNYTALGGGTEFIFERSKYQRKVGIFAYNKKLQIIAYLSFYFRNLELI